MVLRDAAELLSVLCWDVSQDKQMVYTVRALMHIKRFQLEFSTYPYPQAISAGLLVLFCCCLFLFFGGGL